MPRTQRLPRAQRREQLLETAKSAFSTSGFAGTSMEDIAVAAGVTKPVIYQHFDSKEAIFLAVIERIGEGMLASANMVSENGMGTDGRLRDGVMAFRKHLDTNELRLFTRTQDVSPEVTAAIQRITRDLTASVAQILSSSRDLTEEEASALAAVLIAVLQTTALVVGGAVDAEHGDDHGVSDRSAASPEALQVAATRLLLHGLAGFPALAEPRISGYVLDKEGRSIPGARPAGSASSLADQPSAEREADA